MKHHQYIPNFDTLNCCLAFPATTNGKSHFLRVEIRYLFLLSTNPGNSITIVSNNYMKTYYSKCEYNKNPLLMDGQNARMATKRLRIQKEK